LTNCYRGSASWRMHNMKDVKRWSHIDNKQRLQHSITSGRSVPGRSEPTHSGRFYVLQRNREWRSQKLTNGDATGSEVGRNSRPATQNDTQTYGFRFCYYASRTSENGCVSFTETRA